MKRVVASARWIAGAIGCLALAGCGAVTSTGEYGLYRRAATSTQIEDRLAAAYDYLHRYKDGAFEEEVGAWYRRAELLYWRNKRGSAAGLAAYLRTLPAGPHGVEAAQRLADLRDRSVHGDAMARQALATNAKLARASADRARVRDEVAGWVTRFLAPDAFKTRLVEERPELLVPWTLSLPSPRCTEVFDRSTPGVARRCTKTEEFPYLVIGPRGGEPREATIELTLEEDVASRPVRFTIAGPELFLRLEEAAVVRRFDPKNSDHRVAGIARAVGLVRDAFAGAVGDDPSCVRKVVAPVVLDLACRGRRVTATAGIEAGEDDSIVVRATHDGAPPQTPPGVTVGGG